MMNSFGMVYGNMAVSPLYIINQIFFGPGALFPLPQNIYGAVGLLIWIMTIVVTLKYILVVLAANQNGEGGPFILKSLIKKAKVMSPQLALLAGTLLIFAVGLLIGDGMITPALSLTAAFEGLQFLSSPPSFPVPYFAFVILTILFFIQQGAIPRLRRFLGWMTVGWLIVLLATGINPILRNPEIINALNPSYILVFVSQASAAQLFTILGATILLVVGAEVIFANLGFIGRKRATIAWFLLVYPAIAINLLGQGAYLLSGSMISHGNIFFSMIPQWLLYPVIFLAVAAAMAVSQAWISMTFSLISQAIAMHLFPRVKIDYVGHGRHGDIYMPGINWFLYLGASAVLWWYQTSQSLAMAYGFASVCAMIITTYAVFTVAASTWQWNFPKVVVVLIPFFCIDLIFFAAGVPKLAAGAYMPIEVALLFFVIMKVWEWGRRHMKYSVESYHITTMKDLVHRKIGNEGFLPRSVIIMTPHPINHLTDRIPSLEQLFINQNGLLPKNIIFLTVLQHTKPYMYNARYQVNHFYKDQLKGQIASVCLNFGFKEEPNVEKQLLGLARHRLIAIPEHPNTWLVHVLEEHVIRSKSLSVMKLVAIKLYDVLEKNSIPLGEYFGLGNVSELSSEFLPVKLNS